MEGSKVIQHLLRPADTCVIVVQGYLMGATPPSRRLIAVVKHEGTEEHALFLFEMDTYSSPTCVKVEAFYPIKGSFNTEVKVTEPSQCHVLLNNGLGSSIALQLAYDEHTAVFISQIKKALHQLAQSGSAIYFSWLLGYENCRTGWDRFTKPVSLTDTSLTSDPYPIRDGFPETWPWSHIITPNSDGKTEIAQCELLENFDPLHVKKNTPPSKPSQPHPSVPDQPRPSPPSIPAQPHPPATSVSPSKVQFSVTNPSPSSSPSLSKTSPFHSTDDSNPFVSSSSSPSNSPRHSELALGGKGLKHGISDTNVHKLEQEFKSLDRTSYMETLMTRSEEDLTATSSEPSSRHCVAKTTRDKGGHTPSPKSSKGEADDGRFSKSLFFLKLDENDWVTFENEEDTKQLNGNGGPSPSTRHRAASKLGSKHKLEFLNPSGIKPITTRVNMHSPELSGKHNRKGVLNRSRDRSKSALPAMMEKSSQWVSRYRPGVATPIPGETARESIMQSELRHREKLFCSPVKIRVFCGTWNVNGRVPPSSMDPLLREYEVKGEKESPPPDIYAIGFQELDLSAQCLLTLESNREGMWVESVEDSLAHVGNYVRLQCVRLVGIMLVIYVKETLVPFISDVEVDQISTGMHGYMGNKGGVGVHFNLYHSSLCFINTHFSAHMEEVDKRNQEFAHIMNKMLFTTPVTPYDIVHHDMIFWLGDLNYRVSTSAEMSCDQIKAHADNYQFGSLFKLDQLLNEMKKGNVFVGYQEATIDFKPSYKYDPNSDNWDTSEKHRAPAWCDRILHRGKDIVQCSYSSHPALNVSDHKPVSAIFDSMLREVNPVKEKSVLEQITWRLDKLENDTLPQVDLNVTEFIFQDVRFKAAQSRRLVVTNTGQRPVHISFIPKLDDTALTKEWLTVKPTSAVIHPLEDAVIEFTVLVDEDSAPPLTTGKTQMEDILVLHLEKGKDFFITVSGNYLPSCFGSSLDTLVNLHTYIREVPVAKLVDLTSSWEECVLEPRGVSTLTPPALDIPKELFAIVDFIERNGIDKEGLFSGGLQAELEEIIDMLDTGGRDLPGSVFSVGSILLTFLAALAEPVIPVNLHSRCMDASNNATLCKQILSQVPSVHKATFNFLINFMKNLLKYSEENLLEPKVLATVFGEVLLRTPLSERKSKSRRQLNAMNRKKATFLYQFLVNDLIVPPAPVQYN